jgi:hypothetical protein
MAASLMLGVQPGAAAAATLLPADKAGQVVTVRNVTVKDGVVSGEVVNKSQRTLREVQLLIRYSWLWKDEFQPGKDDPSMAVYHTVEKEIAPGGTLRFTYKPASPLPSRPDGSFETSVSVAGFTEVIR